jgi:hypothetical protein
MPSMNLRLPAVKQRTGWAMVLHQFGIERVRPLWRLRRMEAARLSPRADCAGHQAA